MSKITAAAKLLLSDVSHFSNLVIRLPLRDYQVEPLRAILDSILHRKGLEFLLIFPRQSGKNEAVAQLLVYLLNLYQRAGGNIVYGATGATLKMGTQRLDDRLQNPWNSGRWTRRADPDRRSLGNASVLFLSTHPYATARGQTAHILLVIDETQDQVASHIEAVFTPMRAAYNTTAVYIGTVKTTADYLWQKKRALEAEQARDGIQRVWMVSPETVSAENPEYRVFLDAQVRHYGRHHPIIASEYFLEPLDAAGGLFDARRQALMHGTHPRLVGAGLAPAPGALYVATLDVAGEDEAATDPIAALDHPGRDYTVATLFQVTYPPPGTYAPGPTYDAVDVFVDHGSKHFQDHPGQPALVHRLIAWLQHWHVAHLIADSTGVGHGMIGWLTATLGPGRITPFVFSSANKALLGSLYLSLVETGRFHYWTGDEEEPGSDGWWFWRQVAACSYEVPPDGRFDHDLRWGVPAGHKTEIPAKGGALQPTHDDRLLSAALVAELDQLLRGGNLILGRAESAIVQPVDPLDGLTW